jgi:integrase
MKATDIVPAEGKREDVIFGKRLKQVGLFDLDENIPAGFGLRVRPGSDGIIRSWVMQYRVHGRMTRLKIGDAHNVTPTQALLQARKVRGQIDFGNDPQADKKARREKDKMTFGFIVKDFFTVKTGRKNTLKALRVYLNSHAKPLHSTPIDKITKKDIAARTRAVQASSGASAAGGFRAAMSTLFAWAMENDLITVNPVIGSYSPPPAKERDRVLSDAELAAIWNALDGDSDYGRIVRLLTLTGCRREEIGGMRWSELNEDHTEWELPGERAKNGRAHKLPITPLMAEIIYSVPRRVGIDCLFGARGVGFTRWVDGRKALEANVSFSKPWKLHDVRRSVATRMCDLDVPPHIVEAVLNHVSGHKRGIGGIYNRSKYEPQVRAAMLMWSDHIAALISGGERKIVAFEQHVVHKSA